MSHKYSSLFTEILGTQTQLKDQSVTSFFLAIYLALNWALKTMKIKVHIVVLVCARIS